MRLIVQKYGGTSVGTSERICNVARRLIETQRGGCQVVAVISALAGTLNADACQIFTDVDGVFTCDPRIVLDAQKLKEISYEELLEMAGGGAQVMQSRAVEFAKKFGVEFEVRSSFKKSSGT